MDSGRAGGLSLIIGILLTVVGNLTHPRAAGGELGSGSVDTETGLIVNNLGIWYPSHVLITVSIPILLFGYVTVYRMLRDRDGRTFSVPALLSIVGWATLSFLAIIIDGFLTPLLAQNYANAAQSDKALTGAIFDYNFLLSLTFLAPAFLGYTIGISLLGASLVKTKTHHKWFGTAGIVVGLAGLLGYVAGIFGPYWVLSLAFTPYITIVAVWVIILGILQFRATPTAK